MVRVAIVYLPGTNCETETLAAARAAGADAYEVWHRDQDLHDADVVILPGGFAYGDYLRAGAIARFSPVMNAVIDHAQKGGPTLGICNGFQVLCEAGLLPGALVRNAELRFLSRPVEIRIEADDTPFTATFEPSAVRRWPIAHGEGRYVADEETLAELQRENQILFRYLGENPNRSIDAIAGICSANRNVVGLMPHPERCPITPAGEGEGMGIFHSMMTHAGLAQGGMR